MGVPKLVSKEPTVFEPFHISHTNKAPAQQEEETVAPFKATSVNKDMLARSQFVPKPSDKELTEVKMTRDINGPSPSTYSRLPDIHTGALSSVSNSSARCNTHQHDHKHGRRGGEHGSWLMAHRSMPGPMYVYLTCRR